MKQDEKFIKAAIKEAMKALREGNSPYGTVLVKDNKIIVKGHNTVTTGNDPTAHGEINVIRKLCKKLRTKNLEGYTLYSNAEPCPMCATACVWAGIKRIVYGAPIQDIMKLRKNQIKISCKEIADKGPRKIEVVGGILKEESLKHFRTSNFYNIK